MSTKFKVGDKAIVKVPSCFQGARGSVVEINPLNDWLTLQFQDGETVYFRADELQKIDFNLDNGL